jgi:hypothetical protein
MYYCEVMGMKERKKEWEEKASEIRKLLPKTE